MPWHLLKCIHQSEHIPLFFVQQTLHFLDARHRFSIKSHGNHPVGQLVQRHVKSFGAYFFGNGGRKKINRIYYDDKGNVDRKHQGFYELPTGAGYLQKIDYTYLENGMLQGINIDGLTGGPGVALPGAYQGATNLNPTAPGTGDLDQKTYSTWNSTGTRHRVSRSKNIFNPIFDHKKTFELKNLWMKKISLRFNNQVVIIPSRLQ